MRVIVTGANGFVGTEIVDELLEDNDFVYKLVRKKTKSQTNKLVEVFEADITDPQAFSDFRKLENIDAIVHSAGLAHQFGDIEKEEFYKVNVLGTKNIAELAAELKVKQFILISSTAVYGLKQKRIDEETICQPETVYASSKLEAENVCIDICQTSGLPVTILRLAPVIGERNTGNAARLVSAIDRKRFIWIGRGKNLKTLVYKTDVARAVLKILKNKNTGIEIFNLAANPISMKNFVAEIESQLGKNAPKIYVPAGILQLIFSINEKTFGIGKVRKLSQTVGKWLSDDVYSAQKIKEKYDFEPTTTMATAIEKQIKYYLDEKKRK